MVDVLENLLAQVVLDVLSLMKQNYNDKKRIALHRDGLNLKDRG